MGLVFFLFLFLSLPTAAGAQHFWKLLLAGSLSGGRQFIISPAVDMGIRCRAGGGGGGGWGRGCTAGLLKAKGRRAFVFCLPGSGYNCFWVYIPMYNWLRLASGESVARLSH